METPAAEFNWQMSRVLYVELLAKNSRFWALWRGSTRPLAPDDPRRISERLRAYPLCSERWEFVVQACRKPRSQVQSL